MHPTSTQHRRRTRRSVLTAALALTIVAGACGAESDDGNAANETQATLVERVMPASPEGPGPTSTTVTTSVPASEITTDAPETRHATSAPTTSPEVPAAVEVPADPEIPDAPADPESVDDSAAGAVSQTGADFTPPAPVPPPPPPAPTWQQRPLELVERPTVPEAVAVAPAPVEIPAHVVSGSPTQLTSNAFGCASNCITSALLTPDAKFARLGFAIETKVATTTHVWVSSTQPVIDEGEIVMTSWPTVSNAHASHQWATTLDSLQYDTTYWITVMVVDQQGNERWAITDYTTIDPPQPDNVVAAGSECVFQCITEGFIYSGATFDTVDLVVVANTFVDFDIAVSPHEPGSIGDNPLLPHDVPFVVEQNSGKAVRGHVAGLADDTVYHVVVAATDGDGQTAYAVGSFRTDPKPPPPPAPTNVLISFNRYEIFGDGDEGTNDRGELALRWGIPDAGYSGIRGEEKIASDTTVQLPAGSGRWVAVEDGGHLPTLVANTRERDGHPGSHCTAAVGDLHMSPTMGHLCDAEIAVNVAVLAPQPLSWLDELPTCAVFGYDDWRQDHKCAAIASQQPGDDYATFRTIVSFYVEP